jgi:phage gp29-like protein
VSRLGLGSGMELLTQEATSERLAGLASMRAAAATDASTKNSTVYQPSVFDRLVLPEGQKYTPDHLSRYLRDAHLGRTRDLFGFYSEMRARDPHLDNEIVGQTDMIASANLDALPFPSFKQPVKGAALTGDAAIAEEVSSFLFERYSAPDYKLTAARVALCDGEWMGVGGYELDVQPDPRPGKYELIRSMEPIPPQRWWTELNGTRLMFQPYGTWEPLIPVEDLGPKGTAQLVVHQTDVAVPSPSRRGVLRRCLNYWLIKQRGIVWWAQFVQNFGSPQLMGFYDVGTDGAKAILERAFNDFGQGSKMILPKGSEVTPLESANRLARETPHEAIADWCDRQVSKVVSGHDQSSGVQADTSSKQSSETGQEKSTRRAQSRADRIADTIREWDAKPAVAREFGPDIAARFTSILTLHVDRPKDLQALSEAFKNFDAAHVESIPVQEFHDITGIRSPEDGEECLGDAARVRAANAPPPPVALPFGRPMPVAPEPKTEPADPKAADEQAAALARILPFARDVLRAAKAESTDPHAALSSLLKKAAQASEGAGEEIVKPYRDLIVAAVKEGATINQIVTRVMHRQKAQLDAPRLMDLLAATIAEAALQGVQLERRAAEAAS